MKNILFFFLLVFAAMSGFFACSDESKLESDAPQQFTEEQIKRGDYLVTSIGCDDCHSPKIFTEHGPEPDMSRRLSGHPADEPLGPVDTTLFKHWILFSPSITSFAGPWGASFAANLTSDATGIGNWSFDQFKKAMREGKYKGLDGGRMILPPMPWPQFKNFTDEDLEAIFAFLKSTKPIRNIVPGPVPPNQLKNN